MCERICDGGHIQMAEYAKRLCDDHGFYLDVSSGGDIVIRPDLSKWVARDKAGKIHPIFSDTAHFRFKNTHAMIGFFSGWSAQAGMNVERNRLMDLGTSKKKARR